MAGNDKLFSGVGRMEELRRGNNLSELVLEKIQKSILARELLPGQLLPSEKEMAEKYGVGKSSVREAIKMLEVLGVAECVQGKGTYLRESLGSQVMRPLLYDLMLQQSTAEELYEFRVMFDTATLHLAAAKATEEDKRLARQRFLEYKSFYEADLPASQSDRAFHRTILEATRNQFIIKVGVLILELCDPYLEGSSTIHNDEAMENHERLLEIFCSGDTAGIEEVVSRSMSAFKEVLDREKHEKAESATV